MFDITKNPSDDDNVSLLTLVKIEPSIIKKELCSSEVDNSSSSNRGTSLPDSPITDVKVEVLDDAHFREDEGSVGPGCSSYPDALTKQELEIGPTELQPPDIQYMLQPCKPDPDYHKQQQFTEDIPQAHELLVVKGEDFTQQPDHGLLQNSPRRLSQELNAVRCCQPLKVETGEAIDHYNKDTQLTASEKYIIPENNKINPNTIELLPHTSGVPSPVVLHNAPHRNEINVATSHSSGENTCDNVNSKRYKLLSWKSNLLSHKRVNASKHYFQNIHPFHQNVSKDNSIFECDFCHSTFLRKSKLISHMRIHDLTRLMRVHTNEKPLKCKFCGKRFSYSSGLTVHIRMHTGEKPFQCMSCGKNFAVKSKLTRHIRLHTGVKLYQCKSCEQKFARKSSLTRHIQVHTGERPYQFKFCDKKLATKSSLTEHIRVHTGKKTYQCNSCDKSYTAKSSLTEHMRVHTGEKPYQCKSCDKRFSARSSLVRTGKKPYQCKACDKRFTAKPSLYVRTGEKPYQCKSCDKRFTAKPSLTAHMRLHTGEKPYQCKSCDKRFTVKSSLTEHIRVHTGERPYQCKSCDKSFTTKSSLYRHKRVHTG